MASHRKKPVRKKEQRIIQATDILFNYINVRNVNSYSFIKVIGEYLQCNRRKPRYVCVKISTGVLSILLVIICIHNGSFVILPYSNLSLLIHTQSRLKMLSFMSNFCCLFSISSIGIRIFTKILS